VRIEYGTVVAFFEGVLILDVGGTSAVLSVTISTEILGNLDAATLVRAEGIRASDGSVSAELVEVLCPDSARV
jgi:hypothetical protein